MRRPPGYRLAGEDDVTIVGAVHAGDQVEDGRLAGPVGPDHADDLPVADLQLQLGQRAQAAERQREAVKHEDGPALRLWLWLWLRLGRGLGLGAHVITSTRRAPSRPCGRE